MSFYHAWNRVQAGPTGLGGHASLLYSDSFLSSLAATPFRGTQCYVEEEKRRSGPLSWYVMNCLASLGRVTVGVTAWVQPSTKKRTSLYLLCQPLEKKDNSHLLRLWHPKDRLSPDWLSDFSRNSQHVQILKHKKRGHTNSNWLSYKLNKLPQLLSNSLTLKDLGSPMTFKEELLRSPSSLELTTKNIKEAVVKSQLSRVLHKRYCGVYRKRTALDRGVSP